MNVLKISTYAPTYINSGNIKGNNSPSQTTPLEDIFVKSASPVSFRGGDDSPPSFDEIVNKLYVNYNHVNKMEAKGSVNSERVDWHFKSHRKIANSKVNNGALMNSNGELRIEKSEIKNYIENIYGDTQIVDSNIIGNIKNYFADISISGSFIKGDITCDKSDISIKDSILEETVIGFENIDLENCIFVKRQDKKCPYIAGAAKRTFRNIYFVDEKKDTISYIKFASFEKGQRINLEDIFKNAEKVENVENPKLKTLIAAMAEND